MTLVETVSVRQADDAHHVVVAVLHLLAVVVVITLHAKMIGVIMTAVTAEIDPAAPMTGNSSSTANRNY